MKLKQENGRIFVKILIVLFIFLIIMIGLIEWWIVQSTPWAKSAKDEITANVFFSEDENNRSNISINDVPDNLKNAYISIEDQRFYLHWGIDFKRTAGVFVSFVENHGQPTFGGSTITQQLVKNLTGDDEDTAERKIREWGKALALERELSKDEILEAYLNIIYVGSNIYGVEQGAKYYFNKNVQELTLAECAFLAGLTHSPNSYNPFRNNSDFEKIAHRTKVVLEKMLELKYIDPNEYNSAIQEVENGLNFEKGNSNLI